MESTRRDLLNDMGKHWSILKNNVNTYYLSFGSTPKTRIAIPKTGVLFLLCSKRGVENAVALKLWWVIWSALYL